MLHFDRVIAAEFDASIFVSAHEAAVFKELAPESKQHVSFINNGVDSHYFQRSMRSTLSSDSGVGFTGAMDYWANVDAVTWFAERFFRKFSVKSSQRISILSGAPE